MPVILERSAVLSAGTRLDNHLETVDLLTERLLATSVTVRPEFFNFIIIGDVFIAPCCTGGNIYQPLN
jgi:hypothetical protein